jgi:hypothetical protein
LIYAIEAVGSMCVKIGYCTDFVRLVYRWKQLDTHSPHKLTLLGVVWSGSREQEKDLHYEWEPHWVKGEWFLVTPLRSAITRRFQRAALDARSFEIADLLKTQKEGDLPLLLTDERFSSLNSIRNQGYQPGQESWLSAKESAEAVHRAAETAHKQGRHGGHVWPEIVRLRNEGLTFESIGAKLGKSGAAVYASWRRAQTRLNKLNKKKAA